MPRLTLIALAALAAASPLAAQGRTRARPPAAQVPEIPFTQYTLKNGLTLIVHEDHKAPIVAVNVWYHVGSKNERPGRTGFAHLFEHLMFQGSENHNADFIMAVQAAGGTDLNGTTSNDRTNYFQNVPVQALDRILFLESDRMGHLLGVIDQARLDEQRGVVQNEKRQGESQPYGKTWITMTENTWPAGHPYSWSVIGSMDDLNAATLDDVKDWFRTWYGASNTVLVVAGDVTAEDVKARVERYFGDVPPGPPLQRKQAWVARRTGTQRQVLQDRVPQARVLKVWNVPEYGSPDAGYLQLAAAVLGQGKSSRLYRRLVYTDRIATDASSFTFAREIASQVIIMATAQPGGDLGAVERAIDEELGRFLQQGPTAAELERVKVQLRSDFVRGLERIGGFGGKSDVLAQSATFLGDPGAYRARMEHILAATPAQVREAAVRWLSDGQYVLEVRPFPDLAAATTDVDRKVLPPIGPAPSAPLATPEQATLSNGLLVQLVRRTELPIVTMVLGVEGGYAADQGARWGTAAFAAEMLDEGTRTRTALQVADGLEQAGARLYSQATLDVNVVTLMALTDKLDPALDIFADVVLHPAFPASDMERTRRVIDARIRQEKVSPTGMGLRTLPQFLYGRDHAYSQPLTGSGTEATIAAMTREDLVAFHQRWFKPNHARLFVVGDVSLDALVPRLERVFGGWAPGDVPVKNLATVPPRPERAVYIMDRKGAEQSVIFAAQLIPPRNMPGDHAFQLFDEAVAGSYSARLNQNLREDKHWSYGASSFYYDGRGQRPWAMYAPVQTDKTKESLQEVVREMTEAVGPRPVSPDELAAAKERLTRSLSGRWETGWAVADALREVSTFDLPAGYFRTYAQDLNAVTVDDVARVSRAIVQPGHQVILVVGDREKIEPGIRELNLGPVEILDANGKPIQAAAAP